MRRVDCLTKARRRRRFQPFPGPTDDSGCDGASVVWLHRSRYVMVVTSCRSGTQEIRQAVTFAPGLRFHRRFTWRPQLEYSIRMITPNRR